MPGIQPINKNSSRPLANVTAVAVAHKARTDVAVAAIANREGKPEEGTVAFRYYILALLRNTTLTAR
jgi:hypothetical protein